MASLTFFFSQFFRFFVQITLFNSAVIFLDSILSHFEPTDLRVDFNGKFHLSAGLVNILKHIFRTTDINRYTILGKYLTLLTYSAIANEHINYKNKTTIDNCINCTLFAHVVPQNLL